MNNFRRITALLLPLALLLDLPLAEASCLDGVPAIPRCGSSSMTSAALAVPAEWLPGIKRKRHADAEVRDAARPMGPPGFQNVAIKLRPRTFDGIAIPQLISLMLESPDYHQRAQAAASKPPRRRSRTKIYFGLRHLHRPGGARPEIHSRG